jgi:Holliday junction resolvasome RuvABC endonuclease subunit
MTLYMDPSARACGFIVMSDDRQIRLALVMDLIGDVKGTMPEVCREITLGTHQVLDSCYLAFSVEKVVVELPVGSQDARSSWYLATVQAAIRMFALCHNLEYVGIKENEVKKIVHGRAKKIDKSETIQFVIDKLPKFSYILTGNKKIREALADTLAVYYAHNEELWPVKEEKAEENASEPKKVRKRKVG